MNVGRRVEIAVGTFTALYVNSKLAKNATPVPHTGYMPYEDQPEKQADEFEQYMASMVGK